MSEKNQTESATGSTPARKICDIPLQYQPAPNVPRDELNSLTIAELHELLTQHRLVIQSLESQLSLHRLGEIKRPGTWRKKTQFRLTEHRGACTLIKATLSQKNAANTSGRAVRNYRPSFYHPLATFVAAVVSAERFNGRSSSAVAVSGSRLLEVLSKYEENDAA